MLRSFLRLPCTCFWCQDFFTSKVRKDLLTAQVRQGLFFAKVWQGLVGCCLALCGPRFIPFLCFHGNWSRFLRPLLCFCDRWSRFLRPLLLTPLWYVSFQYLNQFFLSLLRGSQADLLHKVHRFLFWPSHCNIYRLLYHQTFSHRFFCPPRLLVLPQHRLRFLAFLHRLRFPARFPLFRMFFILRGLSWGMLLQELSAFDGDPFSWLNGEYGWYQHSQPLCDTCPWFLAFHQISDRIFEAFGDEIELVHLQSFVHRDDKTSSVLWYGWESGMHKPVFQQ